MGNLNFRLKYSIEQRKEKHNVPKEIRLEVTKRCNLNCSFCFNKQTKTKGPSLNSIKKIIDNVYDSKIKAIRITGGEPFIRTDLKDIVGYAKSKNLYVIINTNGTLIEPEVLRFTDSILLSFHNIKRNDEIKKNIKIFKKYNIIIRLATILTKQNIDNLETFYKKAKKLEFNEWFFLRPVLNIKEKQLITKKGMQIAVEKIMKNNEKFDLSCFIANSVPSCIFKDLNKVDSVCVGGINDSGNSRLVIDTNANIKTDYFSDDILGDAFKDNLKNVWEGLKDNILPEDCKKCSSKSICLAGISIWNKQNQKTTNDPLLKSKI